MEPVAGPLTIEVLRGELHRTGEQDDAMESAWRALCAENPRYFNGRILSFESYDRGTGIVTARDVEYRAHAVRGAVDLGITFFGITGVMRVVESGVSRFLVGRRAPTVHEYPGQWEFAPCGGIDPPGAGRGVILQDEIIAELVREGAEELGLELELGGGVSARPLALVHDDPVGSTDLMVLVGLPGRPAMGGNWEYTASRWLTLDEIGSLHADAGAGAGETVIPTTLAMAAWLHASQPGV